MLTRAYRGQESLVRYWAMQAVALCYDIDDAATTSLAEFVPPVLEAIAEAEMERRVMIVGDKGCGKSSLLAGLAECPLIARAEMPGPYLRWRFRRSGGTVENSRFIPLEHLEGLELVDSRSCADAGMADLLRGLMPGADVLIAVLDGRAPEDSAVWNLLESPEAAAVEATVFAVTFANGPDVSNRVRELCRERLQRNLPIYCINPENAPAMEVFCDRIQDALNSPSGLRAAIRNVEKKCDDLMYKQASALKTLDSVDQSGSNFLRQIDEEIDHFLVRQRADLPRLLEAYALSAFRARPRLLRRLRWVFGWGYSPVTLLRLEKLGAGCELYYYYHMREEVLRFQRDLDSQFVISCASHWKSARPRMQKELSCEIGEFPQESLVRELASLRAQLGRELYKPFTREQIRHRFSLLFCARAGWMRACLSFICLFLAFAGLFGLLGQNLLALGLVGMSALIWLGASLAHTVANCRIHRAMNELGQLLDNSVRMALGESVANLVTSRMAAYRRLYALPRHKVDELKLLLTPLQERHLHVFRQLRSASATRG